MKLKSVFQNHKTGPIPVWMMRQAGRHLPEYREIRKKNPSFMSLCYNPEIACEITLQPVRRYGFDAAILFSDILVIPDALGQKVNFVEGKGIEINPVTSGSALARLDTHRILSHLQPVFETISRVRENLTSETALIGFCGAPWTVAVYMTGSHAVPHHMPIRSWSYNAPEDFSVLISLLVEASITYLDAQVKAGADVLQIFESWGNLLPQKEFERWCMEPIRKIISALKESHPDVPVIIFSRGIGYSFVKLASYCLPDGLSLDSSFPLDFARKHLQPHVVLQGNLDPVLLAVGGPFLDKAVDTLLDELGEGAFIFNLGHGILPQTPPEHVAHVVKKIRERSH
ncbi:MAG: uroporphyrinogen decarboxylase [Alphaproteobacteria bacterium]|nr:uroporphyrinogen decarboxylase [Alphaproteobacteria bacterium]